MLTTLLALSLLATAPAAPDAPATPALAPAPVALPAAVAPPAPPCRVPAPRVVVIDGPSWVEDEDVIVLPAAAPRVREVRSETTLVVPRSTELQVNNFSGRIEVHAWGRGEVRVVAEHARRDHLEPRLENGTLVVAVTGRHGEPAPADLVLSVPEWMPLHLNSVESPIDVQGLRAAIEAASVRGDVIARRCRGVLQLSSVLGGVRVLDAQGRVKAASINNLVQLERVIGEIDAESVNGDIQMTQVESPDVDASSVNGGVLFDGPFQPRGRYRLASHNGNLRVGVPVGSDVDVSVATFNGAFESGIPVQIAPHGHGRRFTFTLGGGGASLQLQSFQGMIQLLRSNGLALAPPPPPPPAHEEDK